MNHGAALPSIYLRFGNRAGSPRLRNRSLERLLTVAEDAMVVSDWRADAQRLLSVPGTAVLEAGPVLCHRDRDSVSTARAAQVFLVQALHAQASLTSVGLPRDGLLTLSVDEARLLAEDFNRVFAGGSSSQRPDAAWLAAGADGRLYGLMADALNVQTFDPTLAIGHELWDFRARGPDAAWLARLGSETEMWLFDHIVNRARRERGEAEINALWLWGGGPVLTDLPRAGFDFVGEDVFFSTWITPGGAVSAGTGRLILCDVGPGEPAFGTQAQSALDSAAKALRRGLLDAVYLSTGRQCIAVRRMPRRFSFRRNKPWWEYFDDTD